MIHFGDEIANDEIIEDEIVESEESDSLSPVEDPKDLPLNQRIEKLAEEAAHREGCRIYDVEFFNGPTGRVLRVSIDHPERSVGIEDCSNVSKALNLLLDVEDIVPGSTYSLEVSSPGLERQLKRPWHFQGAVGKTVKFRLKRTLESYGVSLPSYRALKQFKETILSVTDSGVNLKVGEESVNLPFGDIEKAQLVFEYGSKANEKPKGKPRHNEKHGKK